MGSRRRRGRRKEKQETGETRGRTGVKHISTLAHYLAGREAGVLWGEMNCKSLCLCLFFPLCVCVCSMEREREKKESYQEGAKQRYEAREKAKDGQTDRLTRDGSQVETLSCRRAAWGKEKTAAGLQGGALTANTSRMKKVKSPDCKGKKEIVQNNRQVTVGVACCTCTTGSLPLLIRLQLSLKNQQLVPSATVLMCGRALHLQQSMLE